MSIATAITAAQGRVANCYTAISNKGGTLPATQNLANMPTAIGSIPSGGGSTKYGASIDSLLGNVDANGVLQQPTEQSDLVFTGVKDITNFALYYRFYGTKVKSVSFIDLITISGIQGCTSAFSSCLSLTSVSFPKLTTVLGISCCTGMFSACQSLVTISLPNLSNVLGSNCFSSFLGGCSNLTNIYFNSLTTTSFGSSYVNQFNSMFNSVTGSVSGSITMHLPSNLSSTISRLTGYPNFGATAGRLTLAFDLPATT